MAQCPEGQVFNEDTGQCEGTALPPPPPPPSVPTSTPEGYGPGSCDPWTEKWSAEKQMCIPDTTVSNPQNQCVNAGNQWCAVDSSCHPKPFDCATLFPAADDGHGCIGTKKWDEAKQKCVQRTGGGPGGPGAAGGPGGGGGGGGSGLARESMGWLHDDDIWSQIEGLMTGGTSAFDDDTLNRMYGELHQATQGRTRAAGREIQLDAMRRGMTRSGMVTDAMAGVQRSATSEYTGGVRKILIEKAKSDVMLKVQGIQMAQAWLGQRRQYILGLEGTEAQKELGLAQIRLGYARIQAEIRMTQMQINAMGSGGGGGDDDWAMLSGLLSQALAA